MDWHAEAEFTADLDPDQLDVVAAGVRAAHYNTADKILRLSVDIHADDYATAVDEARLWVQDEAEPAVRQHAPDAQVLRVSVESTRSRAARWAVGAMEAAALLGVSTTRLRRLEGSPGFPEPVAEPAGGALYRTDEIETYRRTRVRGKGGRPRKDA